MEERSVPVVALIVNWRSAGDTIKLMETLLPEVERGLRFVVLENGSGDDSGGVLRERFAAPDFAGCVTYLTSDVNLGFCGGVNRALDAALSEGPKPDYIWMLNPDIYPPEGLLAEMIAVAKESGCPIVSPRAGEFMDFAGEERWPLPYFAPGFMWKTKPQTGRRWWTTQRYHGGCVIFETQLVERLIAHDGEFMHEPLFMYWDEWDVSIRASRLGARVAVANIGVKHFTDDRFERRKMNDTRMYYGARNSMLMAYRHFPWWQRPLVAPLQVARSFIYYCMLHGDRHPYRAFLRGTVDGVRGRSGMWDRHAT